MQKKMVDAETSNHEGRQLQRHLTNRHVQLIAIGGAIGTGLFMGSGKMLALAGTSIIFVYLLLGFFLFFVMRAMGELLLSNLNYKSFVDFITDLVGPWAGFFTGWTYWFCWIMTCVADIVAISHYVQYWFPLFPQWLTALSLIGLLLILNLATVKLFGEMEFWFAMIKIVAIIGLIFTGFIMALYHYPISDNTHASLTHLWATESIMPQGLRGFLAGFQIAIFSFVGIELIGTTAAETADPKNVLPKAINAIPLRIIAFYIFSLMAILVVVPFDSIGAQHSPFIQLFEMVGLPAAASLINFVVLTSAASSANSGLFSGSRILFGLSQESAAPKWFAYLSKNSVPASALFFSCCCLLISSVLMYFIPSIAAVFTLVTTAASILFMFVWLMILVAYLCYRKKRSQLHKTASYKMPAGLIMSWATIGAILCLLMLLALEKDTSQALMAMPYWFVFLSISYFIMKRTLSKSTK